MTDFIVDPIDNKLAYVKLLTNVTDSSLFLNFYDSTEGTITYTENGAIKSKTLYRELNTNLGPGTSLLFHDVLIDDATSSLYNKDKIVDYITNGYLSQTSVNITPPTTNLRGVINNTHSLTVSATGDLVKTTALNTFNHTSLSYSLTSDLTKIKILVYKDTDGLSYSLDSGTTCVKITNEGLLYPNEITSYAIQTYDHINIQEAKTRIFIGTLREGLKSFTINTSTSWEQEGSDEVTVTGNPPLLLEDSVNNFYNFRYSLLNSTLTKDSDGLVYDYIPGDYAPCYVLAITNNPIGAGNGILVFVNAEITANNRTHAQSSASGPAKYIYLFKYLHKASKKFVASTATKTPGITQLEDLTDSTFANWTCIADTETRIPKENSPVQSNGEPFPLIYDHLKQLDYVTSNTYDSTTSGNLIAVAEAYNNYYVTNIYSIIGYNNIVGSETRHLQFSKLPSLTSVYATDFTGLSYYGTYVFLTEKEAVWHCNLASDTPSWVKLLNASEDLTISSDFKLSQDSPVTYLSGLCGFGILKEYQDSSLLGIVSCDFGYIKIKLTTDTLLSVSSIELLPKLHSGYLRDLIVLPQISQAYSCGLVYEPSISYVLTDTFAAPVKSITYIPFGTSSVPSTIQVTTPVVNIYKNYTSTESPQPVYYNSNNINTIPLINPNTDQFLDPEFIPTEYVKVKKDIISSPVYNNGYTFDFLYNNLISTYTRLSQKYQTLYLLFRTSQTILLTNTNILDESYTLQSELQIPVIPEISYQLKVPTVGYSFVTIPVSSAASGTFTQ